MNACEDALLRETAAHVIAGGRACPQHELPCWICGALNTLTYTLRCVTHGRFGRFSGWSFAWVTTGAWVAWSGSPTAMCSHHPALEPEMLGFWENQKE